MPLLAVSAAAWPRRETRPQPGDGVHHQPLNLSALCRSVQTPLLGAPAVVQIIRDSLLAKCCEWFTLFGYKVTNQNEHMCSYNINMIVYFKMLLSLSMRSVSLVCQSCKDVYKRKKTNTNFSFFAEFIVVLVCLLFSNLRRPRSA
ncbi:hypothetical protein AMECASPLE_022474 [Ameca splendens]|uniref:Uncharacterized protein n=1 Tax=Ameca splendens TaxID=208324 RepID=A0ABV0Z289_9TELE